jgi:hypothetical protein
MLGNLLTFHCISALNRRLIVALLICLRELGRKIEQVKNALEYDPLWYISFDAFWARSCA